MSKFELYNISLKDIISETRVFEFDLDEAFFKKIDSPEVQKGLVKAKVIVQKKLTCYELQFFVDGTIYIPCNRCLDDMAQAIHHKENLQVKFGDTFSEEDEVVIVPESDGGINIAWFLYEFIALNIPIKHIHPTGECNVNMVSKLKKHIARQKNDDDDDEVNSLDDDDDDDLLPNDTHTDPRCDALQSLTDNN